MSLARFTHIFLTLFCICIAISSTAVAENSPNGIQEENALEGARDWQLTRVKVADGGCRSASIEGYCSKQSVKAGEAIDIMVSTNPARAFRVEFFRTGYYGGRGARLLKTIDRVEGMTQPDPTPGEKDLHECRWKASLSLTIPDNWLSGVYLGRPAKIQHD